MIGSMRTTLASLCSKVDGPDGMDVLHEQQKDC